MNGNIRGLYWKGLVGPFPHCGNTAYIGSGAWFTNHQAGTMDVGGTLRKWSYFVKIVAVPANAKLDNGVWYSAGGIEIGPAIMGSFAITQQILNDPSTRMHGAVYASPAGPGFGAY